jgi:hypothetical protein
MSMETMTEWLARKDRECAKENFSFAMECVEKANVDRAKGFKASAGAWEDLARVSMDRAMEKLTRLATINRVL